MEDELHGLVQEFDFVPSENSLEEK